MKHLCVIFVNMYIICSLLMKYYLKFPQVLIHNINTSAVSCPPVLMNSVIIIEDAYHWLFPAVGGACSHIWCDYIFCLTIGIETPRIITVCPCISRKWSIIGTIYITFCLFIKFSNVSLGRKLWRRGDHSWCC